MVNLGKICKTEIITPRQSKKKKNLHSMICNLYSSLRVSLNPNSQRLHGERMLLPIRVCFQGQMVLLC